MSRDATKLIQTGLSDLGYPVGPIDGLFGPKTAEAARSWLGRDGMPAVMRATGSGIRQGRVGYLVREIVIHCSATRPGWMQEAGLAAQRDEIRHWHVDDNGWRDIGYHWLIGRAGAVLPGRAETAIGAGVAGHNAGVIHICLIGGHGAGANDRFSDHFTPMQDRALRRLIAEISTRTPIERISGHNQYAAKGCPGFSVPAWLKAKS